MHCRNLSRSANNLVSQPRHIAGRSSSATASISNKALRIRPNESLSQAEGEAEIVVDGGEGDVGGVPLPAL
ncbi:hypothetical protein ABIF36_003174 [Bradyrhizobium japonicum]